LTPTPGNNNNNNMMMMMMKSPPPPPNSQYIRDTISNKTPNINLIPYYKGFKGTIAKDLENDTRYITKGNFTQSKNKIDITELPIGTWNEDYIIFLEKLVEDGTIKDYKDLSTDKHINIQIVGTIEDIEKTLKLTSTLSISNMNLFNEKEKLTHYTKPHEIVDDFILKRISYYEKRKQHLIQILEKELILLQNKYKYIQQVLDGSIDLRRKTMEEIHIIMISNSYIKIEDSYNYLIKMSMDSVSIENVETLKKQFDSKQKELDIIKKTSIEESWLNELNDLEKVI
jgi:DNA topoisomerase-2